MRALFESQLALLHQELTGMGALCEEIIGLASQALTDWDESLGKRIRLAGSGIDEKERIIEAICMKLLLRQQPVAKDLHAISAALKMITDLERIGDQGEDIAEIIPHMNSQGREAYPAIQEMARQAMTMVTDSVEAYVRRDAALARSVIDHDDIVDAYFLQIRKALIEAIAADPTRGENALDILMIAKYLERIGDHTVNVAGWVIYGITGEHEA